MVLAVSGSASSSHEKSSSAPWWAVISATCGNTTGMKILTFDDGFALLLFCLDHVFVEEVSLPELIVGKLLGY